LGDVFDEVAEAVVAGDEVSLAVDFDEDAEFASVVNVAGDAAFVGGTRGFLVGGGDAFFAKDLFRLTGVALGFDEGVLAVHHTGAGFVAQVFDNFGINFDSGAHGISSR